MIDLLCPDCWLVVDQDGHGCYCPRCDAYADEVEAISATIVHLAARRKRLQDSGVLRKAIDCALEGEG